MSATADNTGTTALNPKAILLGANLSEDESIVVLHDVPEGAGTTVQVCRALTIVSFRPDQTFAASKAAAPMQQ